MDKTMTEPMEFTEAVFQQVVGKYRIRVEFRNYWSPPIAPHYQ
nr:MAG TPA: Tryptophyllin-3 skin active peptide [Caudoviricetes sp.]